MAKILKPKKGKFLVATPGLVDPNFLRAVVLICAHNKDGTMGLIVNRPTAIPLSKILPKDILTQETPAKAYQGGPVQKDHLLFLHGARRSDWELTPICDGVYLGGSPETLREILSAQTNDPLRCYLGYAGWGAGQLEEEMAQGAWTLHPATAQDIFESDPEGIWSRLAGGGAWALGPLSGPDLN